MTDPGSPRGWATSDRNGMVGNHENLKWQYQWRGTKLINTRVLVWDDELDEPQRQLGTIILPPDPPSLMNARPEQYFIDEYTHRKTVDGIQRYQMDGTVRIESNAQSGNDSRNAFVILPPTVPSTTIIPPVVPGTNQLNFASSTSSMYVVLFGAGI